MHSVFRILLNSLAKHYYTLLYSKICQLDGKKDIYYEQREKRRTQNVYSIAKFMLSLGTYVIVMVITYCHRQNVSFRAEVICDAS